MIERGLWKGWKLIIIFLWFNITFFYSHSSAIAHGTSSYWTSYCIRRRIHFLLLSLFYWDETRKKVDPNNKQKIGKVKYLFVRIRHRLNCWIDLRKMYLQFVKMSFFLFDMKSLTFSLWYIRYISYGFFLLYSPCFVATDNKNKIYQYTIFPFLFLFCWCLQENWGDKEERQKWKLSCEVPYPLNCVKISFMVGNVIWWWKMVKRTSLLLLLLLLFVLFISPKTPSKSVQR